MSQENNKTQVDRYETFLKALEINGLNLRQMSEIMGYSYQSLKSYSMPDRQSTRARKVSDRFVEYMNMKLVSQGKKPV